MTYFRVIFNDGRHDVCFESPEWLGLYMCGDVYAHGVQDIVIETVDLKEVSDHWMRNNGLLG